MKSKTPHTPNAARSFKGFQRTSGLLQPQIRTVGEKRGFAVTRLLTHWAEIVGEATAQIALPVNVSYAKDGFGATLTVLVKGAHAPMLQAELPKIRERVNACYGYNAISKVRITQTAPTGFAEGQAVFSPAPPKQKTAPDPEILATAKQVAAPVQDEGLRAALEALAENVLTRSKR